MFKTETDRLETYKRMFATDDGKQILEDLKEPVFFILSLILVT